MDDHVKDFFSASKGKETPEGRFHDVVALQENQNITWEEVKEKLPTFPRGWYELAHLSRKDRLDFTLDFWLSKFPFHPQINEALGRFFRSLDEIGVYLTQNRIDDPYHATLVYSIKENGGFFRGSPPATEEQVTALQAQFPEQLFPEDYKAFLKIHNGFCKTTDSTGIIATVDVPLVNERFQEIVVEGGEPLISGIGNLIDPASLIPFYESFGMPFFQCFYNEWHTDYGMGNVYYSVTEKTISDPEMGEGGAESMAFPSFTEWLIFYLERIE